LLGAPSVRICWELWLLEALSSFVGESSFCQELWLTKALSGTQFVRALFVRISGCQELCLSGALTVRTLSGALVDEGFVRCSVFRQVLCLSEFFLSGALFCHKHCWSRTIFARNSCCQDLWMSGICFSCSLIIGIPSGCPQ
jgi:hypothetical protein